MRRNALVLFPIVIATFVLNACGFGSVSTTSAPTSDIGVRSAIVEGVRLYGDLDLVRFDKLTYEDNLNDFMCVISTVTFDVLLRRLEVVVEIADSDWQGFTYVAEIQPTDIEGYRAQYTFTKHETSSTHTFVYDDFSGDGNYRFLIGKTTGAGVSGMSAMAVIGFDLTIEGMDARKRIDGASVHFEDYGELQLEFPDTAYGHTKMEASIAFTDSDSAATSVRLEVSLSDDDAPLFVTDLDPASFRGEDGAVLIEDQLFDSLYPGVDYVLTVFVSGNDGVRDFTDLEILSRQFSTEKYVDGVGPRYGIYAHVNRGSITADGYESSIVLDYDESVVIDGFVWPIDLVVRVRDNVTNEILYEIDLEGEGTYPILIPNDALSTMAVIRVESADGRLVLCGAGIIYTAPEVRVVVDGFGATRQVTIDCIPYDGVITGGYIDLINPNTSTVFRRIPFSTWEDGHAEVTVTNVPQTIAWFTVRVHFEYDLFGGQQHLTSDIITS